MIERGIARPGYDGVRRRSRRRPRDERHADAVSEESHRDGVPAGRAHGGRHRVRRRHPRAPDARTASFRCRSTSGRNSDRRPTFRIGDAGRLLRVGDSAVEIAMTYPDGRKYTKDHEWIELAGDRGRVGITDFAQQQLGDVVYVELPEVGAKLKAGQSFGTIESVKAVSELYAPVAGEVVEVNAALKDKPEAVNANPHTSWMIVVRLNDPAEVAGAARRGPVHAARESVVSKDPGARHLSVAPHRSRRCRSARDAGGDRRRRRSTRSIDEAVPARIRLDKALNLPDGHAGARVPARAAIDRRAEPAVQVVHRPRLLRLRHAERDPPERARESRLVHAVHAVPGRDRARPPRSAAQLPDDGPRSHGRWRWPRRRCSTKPPRPPKR